ncbi:hypothetical protein L1987_86141 [Smallanthus sonchifolius]|uniref:Uncharacterized protein n=1 Tax=Smallanthus sonchifolius TaxID=185202 RepID=A0ACB8XYG0_9ASTR|nr:hypothetical protein L1987_86141 [Smallanthus sonchifolius]
MKILMCEYWRNAKPCINVFKQAWIAPLLSRSNLLITRDIKWANLPQVDVIPCVGGPPVPNNQLFNWFRSKEINRGCLCTTDYSGKTGRCDRK